MFANFVAQIDRGIVRTALVESLGEQSMEKLLTPKIAMGRLAEADDVARVIVFLFSDAAEYISGSVSNTPRITSPAKAGDLPPIFVWIKADIASAGRECGWRVHVKNRKTTPI